MDGARSILWYLIAGTRGGANRWRILDRLRDRPYNAHQLAEVLGLDYRTVRHHLRLLEENRLIVRPIGSAYATPYELAPHLRARPELLLEVESRVVEASAGREWARDQRAGGA